MTIHIKNKYLILLVLLVITGTFFTGWYFGIQKERSVSFEVRGELKRRISFDKRSLYHAGDIIIHQDAVIYDYKDSLSVARMDINRNNKEIGLLKDSVLIYRNENKTLRKLIE